MANKPKFIEPISEAEVLPKWMADGRKKAERRARERIQYLTAVAITAIVKAEHGA